MWPYIEATDRGTTRQHYLKVASACVVLKTVHSAGADRVCVFVSAFSKGLIEHKVLAKSS